MISILLGTLAIWAFFGGAITRMAAVQLARKEKIGISEAVRFTRDRWRSFFFAPIFPLGAILVIVVLTIIFGLFHLIPLIGDIFVDGLGWPLILLAGLGMTVILVGLVGWPMMYATISTEGSDSFDALSRSYSYVYQSPWSYLWYTLVAVAYGMVLVFFVGLMGSLTVYLGKWGVSQTPFVSKNFTNREPEYLFVYAPTSYGWRELLLQGTDIVDSNTGKIIAESYNNYLNSMKWYNHVGAFLVSNVWLYLVFLLVLGFGYSYFWTASTIIYLLMRRKVDDTELDEVYLEEDEGESAYSPPPESEAQAEPASPGVTMVEAPSLKTPEPSAASSGESGPLEKTDGNPSA
jgi:hypothetical protein